MVRRSTLWPAENFAAASTCGLLRPAMSLMVAYTVWPALARACAVSWPKPLEAPVMTITYFIVGSLRQLVVERLNEPYTVRPTSQLCYHLLPIRNHRCLSP